MRPRQYQPVEIETLENLEAKLNDTQSPIEIATLLKKIAFTGDLRAIPTLKAYLKHEDRRVRANAIEGLGYYNEESLITIFFSQLEVERDPRTRGNIIKALWRFGHGKVYDELEKMLFSGIEGQVKSALFVAEQIDNEKIYQLVKKLSLVKDRQIRALAKNTLCRLTSAPESFISKNKTLILSSLGGIILIIFIISAFSMFREKKVETVSFEKFKNVKNMVNEALGKKNYSLAIEYLNYILEKNPDDVQALFLLAKSYLHMGSIELAEKKFKECLRKDPRLSWNYIYLAKIYSNKGDKKSLLDLAKASGKLVPNTLPDFFVQVYLYKLSGEWDKAMEILKKIKTSELNEDFKMEFSHLNTVITDNLKILQKKDPDIIAKNYLKKGEYNKAYDFLTIAINQSPMNAKLYFLMSKCCKLMRRYSDAQNTLFKAIKLKLSTGRAYKELSILFREKQDISNAIKAIELSLKYDDSAAAHIEYAKIYFKIFDMDSCIKELEKAKNRTDKDFEKDEINIYHARALAFKHRFSEAINLMKNVKDTKEISAELFNYSLLSSEKDSDFSELRYKLEDLKNISNIKKINFNGILQYRLGKLDDALKSFKILAKKPDFSREYAIGWNNIGVILAKKGYPNKARACFEKSVGALESREAYYNIGCYYYTKDEYKFAIINFKNALKKDPFFIPAANNLALCYQKLEYFDSAFTILEFAKNIENNWPKKYMEIDFNYQKVGERLGKIIPSSSSNIIKYYKEEENLIPELLRTFYYRMITL